MRKKDMIGMLLAGGQGSRLGVLTTNKAKPAVFFGGQYRIIDFPMSNCINSGVDTIGVLTQYQPLSLNKHIGIGIPWDMDRKNGGVTILSPHVKGESGDWYSGTANAIFQNIQFIDEFSPDYVLILGTDHIYKMDYSEMLRFHQENNCDATIAVLEVPLEEASRMGIMNTYENGKVYEFEEKPKNPKSNLASMGIYIFTWSKLKEALIKDNKIHPDSDFGKHIIPMMLGNNDTMFAFRFKDYWRDVGTIEAYWETNMELIKTLPAFNLYEDFWKIYTDAAHQPPSYTGPESDVKLSITSCGCEIYGKVYNSVLGPEVTIEDGAVVTDSIIMEKCSIGRGSRLNRVIVDSNTKIGENVIIGEGENIPNELKPDVYFTGITVIAENSVVPDNVRIGLNCVISGITDNSMYENGELKSGGSVCQEEVVL
ncbi:MAG: glucose-1-phosphate adenylyltransferase [Clostridiales bacterium]|jgi:glucose-1-phosphate adenylyltransferase|nr:glucose-1-phosphate adenylyltransferase [Clostridiales bacterium]